MVPLRTPLGDDVYRELRRAVCRHPSGTTVVLDCAAIAHLDALDAARLLRVVAEARTAGIDTKLAHLSDDVRHMLASVDPAILEKEPVPPARNPLQAIGEAAFDAADAAAEIRGLLRDTAVEISLPFGRRGIKWDRTIHELQLIGVNAVPIVVFISFLVGVVLALNGAQQLRQFGAAIFIANLVAISMTREMGPLMTAVIVSGRTGSAIAAEIGTMVVSEEIDAMRTMALSPVRFLVVPKMVALLVALPLLTVLSNVAGILGGYMIGIGSLDLGSNAYLSQTVQSLFISDVVTGLVKSVVFAILIGVVGTYKGFAVHGGPESVGRATTAAVVISIILCIVANACFTAFFYYTG